MNFNKQTPVRRLEPTERSSMNFKTTALTIILIPIIAFISFFATLNLVYAQKIYPSVKIAGIELGGLTVTEAEKLLEHEINWWNEKGVILKYKDKQWKINPQDLGITIRPNENAVLAYRLGRGKNPWLNLKEQLEILFKKGEIEIAYQLQEDKFNRCINDQLWSIETPSVDAGLIFEKDHFSLMPSKEGVRIKRELLKNNLKKRAGSLSNKTIQIKLKKISPEIKDEETEKAKIKAEKIINTTFKLKYEDRIWPLEKEKIASWLKFLPVEEREIPKSFPRHSSNKILGVRTNNEIIKEYLNSAAPTINQEPVNAELTIKDGRVTVFTLGREGIKLSIDENTDLISKEILSAASEGLKEKEITLKVLKEKPEITTENIENLGITSLIGRGTSNFYGSPKNRRHNIRIGAAKFHGVLIKPGEEFSFNKTLGPIGPSTGYKPELVIKRNKTVPEYGGGLCQVSTTCFRAALYSGLPITERVPHAYPVKYYNPQGMDATIYPPHPDLRFINDTPNHILIQTKIKGNELIFEFYGTDDGREIKINGPYIYDKKRNGAMKATLEREIYRNGVLIKKDTFRSVYNSPYNYPRRSPLE